MMVVSDILARWGTNSMYKSEKEQQPAFEVFGKSCGLNPGPMAEPIILADWTNRAAVEAEYCEPFKSKRGRHAVSSNIGLIDHSEPDETGRLQPREEHFPKRDPPIRSSGLSGQIPIYAWRHARISQAHRQGFTRPD